MKPSSESNYKAVRDRIPEILSKSGKDCDVKELSDPEFLVELENKLKEEITGISRAKRLKSLPTFWKLYTGLQNSGGFQKKTSNL